MQGAQTTAGCSSSVSHTRSTGCLPSSPSSAGEPTGRVGGCALRACMQLGAQLAPNSIRGGVLPCISKGDHAHTQRGVRGHAGWGASGEGCFSRVAQFHGSRTIPKAPFCNSGAGAAQESRCSPVRAAGSCAPLVGTGQAPPLSPPPAPASPSCHSPVCSWHFRCRRQTTQLCCPWPFYQTIPVHQWSRVLAALQLTASHVTVGRHMQQLEGNKRNSKPRTSFSFYFPLALYLFLLGYSL